VRAPCYHIGDLSHRPGRINSHFNEPTSDVLLPSYPATRDVFRDIPAAGEGRHEFSVATDSLTDKTTYLTPSKFRLGLPCCSSTEFARSTVVPPAETRIGSLLKSVYVLAHQLSNKDIWPRPLWLMSRYYRVQIHFKQFTLARQQSTFRVCFYCDVPFSFFIFVSRVCICLNISEQFLLKLRLSVWAPLLSILNLDQR